MKKYLHKLNDAGCAMFRFVYENFAMFIMCSLIAVMIWFCIFMGRDMERTRANQASFRYELVVGFGSTIHTYYVNNYELPTNGIVTFTDENNHHEIRYVSLGIVDRKK